MFDKNPEFFKFIHEFMCNGYIVAKECNLPPFTSFKFEHLLQVQASFFGINLDETNIPEDEKNIF